MTRTVDFRYTVTRNGADLTTITPVEGGEPVLRCDDSAEIHMSLAGEFVPNAQVNWLTDRIRPEIIIDGEATALGTYLPASVEDTEGTSARTLSIEAYDPCWLLQDCKTEDMVFFRSGLSYVAAAEQLLTAAGIALVSSTPSALTLPEDKADWEIGTPYLTIINELLAEINYKPVWFNAAGMAVLEPITEPDAEHIQHVIDAMDPECLVLPGITKTTDIYSAPNVIIVVCENPDKDGDPLVSKIENRNPSSPLSIQARGRRIVKYEKIRGIASQAELDNYAQHLMLETMLAGETAQIQTALRPGWGVRDITAVNYGDFQAICVEHAWEMELRVGGAMRHTLERIVAQV